MLWILGAQELRGRYLDCHPGGGWAPTAIVRSTCDVTARKVFRDKGQEGLNVSICP